jgi:hypothetical protein
MELSDDLLSTIKEFSLPVTRPDWRHLHRMTLYRFHYNVAVAHNEMNLPVINSFTERYDQTDYKYIFGHGQHFHPVLHIVKLT